MFAKPSVFRLVVTLAAQATVSWLLEEGKIRLIEQRFFTVGIAW